MQSIQLYIVFVHDTERERPVSWTCELGLYSTGLTPVIDRLNQHGRVRALVFGNHGEASPDVHHFIAAAARKLARSTWVRLGARSEDEAYGCHVQRFRRDVGIAVAREFARYRLLRVPFIGVPRAVVRDRHSGRREEVR